jgi:hypothetical protein
LGYFEWKITILRQKNHIFCNSCSIGQSSECIIGPSVSGWMVRPPDVPDDQNCLSNLFRFGTLSLGYLFRCQAIWADLLLHL